MIDEQRVLVTTSFYMTVKTKPVTKEGFNDVLVLDKCESIINKLGSKYKKIDAIQLDKVEMANVGEMHSRCIFKR